MPQSDDSEDEDPYESMNPLKANYGLNIGLPKPLMKLVLLIIFIVISIVRLAAYLLIGIITFALSYLLSFSVYCGGIYSGSPIGCGLTQYLSPYVLSGAIIVTGIVITTLAILDYSIDIRQYF